MFFQKAKLEAELKKVKAELLQKAGLVDSIYNVGGLHQIGFLQNDEQTYIPPSDPYQIFLTCGPARSAITKICNIISKFSWDSTSQKLLSFLDKPNNRETFTSILYKTTSDMMTWGEAFWDISNGLIHNIPPSQMIVELDSVHDGFKYSQDTGNEIITFDSDDIVHFIFEPNSIELRGTSKLGSIKKEINLYYWLLDGSNQKYNRNIKPDCAVNLGPSSNIDDIQAFKVKLNSIRSPNELPVGNFEKMDVVNFIKDHNFGTEFVNLQDWFEKVVYRTYGMTDTDRGEISATRASAETHERQTKTSLTIPIMDKIQEDFNRSTLTKTYGGEFEWSKPKVLVELLENEPVDSIDEDEDEVDG